MKAQLDYFKSHLIWCGITILLSGCYQGDVPASNSQHSSDDIDSIVSEHIEAAPDLQSVSPEPTTAVGLTQRRKELDESLWRPEVLAQRSEQIIIQLWDDLRKADNPMNVLAAIPFESISVGIPLATENLDLGIQRTRLDLPSQKLTPSNWRERLGVLQKGGMRLVQSEWHHASFTPHADGRHESIVRVELHALDNTRRYVVRGELAIQWSNQRDKRGHLTPANIECRNVQIIERDRSGMFQKLLTVDGSEAGHTSDRRQTVQPLMLRDLNGDRLVDVVLGGMNQILWNQGDGEFSKAALCPHPVSQPPDTGLLADLNGDGRVDIVTFHPNGALRVLQGNDANSFDAPTGAALVAFNNPTTVTGGDIDQDGDIDLFVGQYKVVFKGGQMPTPYFDANDGYPSFLLRNKGNGHFEDITIESGLDHKRHRRTYGSSFCDVTNDGLLDLVVVSDFAGVDVYRGDGKGGFQDITKTFIDSPKLFGMGHAYGDFDGDGNLDLFVTGMSSTTASRLEGMKLRRPDFEQHNQMRTTMAYGNRMYLWHNNNSMRQPTFLDSVAHTGWSWGCASGDLDNDGDEDIYVANGHLSGESCKDYCTTFWRHDIYAGSSQESEAHAAMFGEQLKPLINGEMSWNGFEHNKLLMNVQGEDFIDIAFLLGVACEFDCRAVICNDLDQDGKVDLLLVEEQRRRGKVRQLLHIYRNQVETDGHWLGLRLHQAAGGLSPLGAKVFLQTATGSQMRAIVSGDSMFCQNAPVVHFGMGTDVRVERLHVVWSNGEESRVHVKEIDRYLDVVSPAASSNSPAVPNATTPSTP